MNYDKLLILTAKNDGAFAKFMINKGFNLEHVWKNDHYSSRKFHILKPLNLHYLLYGFNKEQIEKYDKIILNETNQMAEIAKSILLWNKNVKLKVCMWNIVRDKTRQDIIELRKMGIDIFSFDERDCEKYGLIYAPLMYPYDIKQRIDDVQIEYECYFCAADKNRLEKLNLLLNSFKENNISYKCRILKEKHKKYNVTEELKSIIFMDKPIMYEEMIKEMQKSNCIIEILQEGQSGFTLRVQESLFYDKKLITNNQSIKNYDFYNSNNIFIINNNYDKIKEFLKKPYTKIDNKIKEKYTYRAWLMSLLEE